MEQGARIHALRSMLSRKRFIYCAIINSFVPSHSPGLLEFRPRSIILD